MTPEQATNIDLSKDDHTELQLSPEQQMKFQEYLEGLEDAERDEIISLTQSELAELLNILDMPEDIRRQKSDLLENFIEEQRDEIILQDIIEVPEVFSEEFQKIQMFSKEMLFGAGSPFEEYNISAEAQETLSTGFILSIIDISADNLPSTPVEDIDELLEQITTSINLEESMSLLYGAVNQDDDTGFEVVSLGVDFNGENSQVFMSPRAGKLFFNQLLSGKLSTEEISSRLKNETTVSGESEITLDNLQTDAMQDIESLGQYIIDNKLLPPGTHIPGTRTENGEPASGDDPETEKNWLEKFGPFGAFLKIFEAIFEKLGKQIEDFTENFGESEDGDPNESGDSGDEVMNEELIAQSETLRGIDTGVEGVDISDQFPEGEAPTEQGQEIISLVNELKDTENDESFSDAVARLFSKQEFIDSLNSADQGTSSAEKVVGALSRLKNEEEEA